MKSIPNNRNRIIESINKSREGVSVEEQLVRFNKLVANPPLLNDEITYRCLEELGVSIVQGGKNASDL